MLRSILAVIVGYVVMAIFIAITFTILQFSLGTDRVMHPGSYEVTPTFIAAALALTVVAAVIGGIVAAVIARTFRAVVALAVVVVILAAVSAGIQLGRPAPGPRTEDVSPMEAAGNARQPLWYALLIPVIGAAGVVIGGKLIAVKPSKAAATSD